MASWDLQKGKVIILISHKDEKDYRQQRDWWKEQLQKPDGTQWLESRGASLVTTRIQLAKEGLKSGAEYLFWLDDDMIGPNDGLVNLLNVSSSMSRPIVCGLYMARKSKEERGLAAWMRHPNQTGYLSVDSTQQSRFVQVDVTGLGFALIHRSIFEKLSQPWFDWPDGGPSEDFWFYEKVWKELQIKPLIDMEVRCEHVGVFMSGTDGSFTVLGV